MKIEIRSLKLETIIGILPEEREAPQALTVDLRAEYTYRPGDYLDYARIAETIRRTLHTGKFGLLEEALEVLGRQLFADFPPLETLELSLEKPSILPDCSVAVGQKWQRSSSRWEKRSTQSPQI